MKLKQNSGQATVEYIVLIASIVMVLNLGIQQLRDILYGWNGNKGTMQLIFEQEVKLLGNSDW